MHRTKTALVVAAFWLALIWSGGNLQAYRDLETGTFLTRDPAGMIDGPNLYTYVRQNPWTSFDPEGLSLLDFVAGSLQGLGEAALPAALVPARTAQPSADYKSGLLTGHIGGLGLGALETNVGGGMAAGGGAEMLAGAAVGARGLFTGPVMAAAEPAAGEMILEGGVKAGVGTAVGSYGVWTGANAARLVGEDVNSMRTGEGNSGGNPEGSSAKKTAEENQKEVHGNSKDSTKPQTTYDIVDRETGDLHKTGVTGDQPNQNGTSPRANKQVNSLNREAGYDRYESNVTGTDIPGRRAALAKEQARVDEHAATHGGEGPPGNIRPRPSLPNDQ